MRKVLSANIALVLLCLSCTERGKEHSDVPIFVQTEDSTDTTGFYDLEEVKTSQTMIVRKVKRRPRPVMQDLAHGIISQYDNLFIRYASTIGWDWRLLAAQCYQESGFDPKAVSNVGARGLMQIMPSTAETMGIDKELLFDAETSISGSVRYTKKLQNEFSDIRDPKERIRFILAAYNGGANHVRDAMALAEKHGENPHSWTDTEKYILGLSSPTCYKDPVVKHGYMRGSETSAYVNQIMKRWESYRHHTRPSGQPLAPKPSKRNMKDGSFQSQVKSASEWVPLDSVSD